MTATGNILVTVAIVSMALYAAFVIVAPLLAEAVQAFDAVTKAI